MCVCAKAPQICRRKLFNEQEQRRRDLMQCECECGLERAHMVNNLLKKYRRLYNSLIQIK